MVHIAVKSQSNDLAQERFGDKAAAALSAHIVQQSNQNSVMNDRFNHIHDRFSEHTDGQLISLVSEGKLHTGRLNIKGDRTEGTTFEIMSNSDLTAEKAIENPLSAPIGQFKRAENFQIIYGFFRTDVPVDAKFRADTIDAALTPEGIYAGQRVIVGREGGYDSSALFLGIQGGPQERKFLFKGDSGNEYKLPENEIESIYRAGKDHTIYNFQSGVEQYSAPNPNSGVSFNATSVRDYIALHQQVEMKYEVASKTGRKFEIVKLEYLGIQSVPGEYISGGSEGRLADFLFGKTAAPDNKLYAIPINDVHYLKGLVIDDYKIGGRSRNPGLGQIAASRIGPPIYEKE